MARLGFYLAENNALGRGIDERVGVVLLGRTLLDPPRQGAMTRWSGAIRRRFPQAELVPLAWHLVTHAREDGLRGRATRRPPGDELRFGGLQATAEVEHAWSVSTAGAQACGAKRILLATPPSLTPGALGRRRIHQFVEQHRGAGFDLVWRPAGLWEAPVACALAQTLGIDVLVPAFEAGRPLASMSAAGVLVDRVAWLSVVGHGPRGRVDARQIDALVEHIEAVPDATLIFEGPRALANLGAVAEEVSP